MISLKNLEKGTKNLVYFIISCESKIISKHFRKITYKVFLSAKLGLTHPNILNYIYEYIPFSFEVHNRLKKMNLEPKKCKG